MSSRLDKATYPGWHVVGAAFVLAVFGWGLGLYGPPVYLHAVREARGWPVSLISAAITLHFLVGAVLVTRLPLLHRRLGLATTTQLAGVAVGAGVLGWALAREPWQLFVAALVSGAGWAGTSAAAVNAILSPWFVRERPKALALAYNGASFGGILFQPLWVLGLLHLGYATTAVVVAVVSATVIWGLAGRWFSRTPRDLGLGPDGDRSDAPPARVVAGDVTALPGRQLVANWQFRTLVAGTVLSLFAQTGLLVLLFTHLVPALGAERASWLMAGATIAAMAGRTLTGWLLRPGMDRRVAISAAVGLQVVASLVLLAAEGERAPLLVAGVLLFGAGLGNAVSLPPLIAQVEFVEGDVPRVVALTIAISQAAYAFAPAVFGNMADGSAVAPGKLQPIPGVFATAAALQALAILVYLAGRPSRARPRG